MVSGAATSSRSKDEPSAAASRRTFSPTASDASARRALPTPKRIPFASMLSGRHDCDYVEVTGVIQRAWASSDQEHTLFADVAVEDGVVRAAFWDYAGQDVHGLIDARVRLRGNVGALFGRTEQLRGVSLFVGPTSDIAVLESAPDPFSLPTRSIRSIYNYSAAGEVNRRIRMRGVVTGYVPGHPVDVSDFTSTARFRYVRHVLYVNDGTGGARIETEQDTTVRPGTVVEVAGFPGGDARQTDSRRTPSSRLPAWRRSRRRPRSVPRHVLSPENDAMLVRMEGHFLSMLTNPTQRILVLKVGETVLDADLDAETATGALDQIRPGSVVAVTGVYSYQWGPPPSFRLFLRSADDVTVVSSAPWWTMRHTVVMVVLLALAACVAVLWVRPTANRKRHQYQAVLSERSRVGRELHDTLEQGLAGIALQLEAVAGSLDASPATARRFARRRATDASLQSGRDPALDHGSPIPGAREPRPGRRPDGHGTANDQRDGRVSQTCASKAHPPARCIARAPPAQDRPRGVDQCAEAFRGPAHRHRRSASLQTQRSSIVQDDGCGLEQGLQDAAPIPFWFARYSRTGRQTRWHAADG